MVFSISMQSVYKNSHLSATTQAISSKFAMKVDVASYLQDPKNFRTYVAGFRVHGHIFGAVY